MTPGKTIPLSAVVAGETVIMEGFEYHGRRAHRLAELGLTPGTPITVLQAAAGQPLLIEVRGTRLAVDRGTAASMRVRPCQRGHRRRHHRRGGGWGFGRARMLRHLRCVARRSGRDLQPGNDPAAGDPDDHGEEMYGQED